MSNPLLEISSKDERLASLLSGDKKTTPVPAPPGERKTFKVQSDLLSRLEDFLPKIRNANAELEEKLKADPKSLDIENVDETSDEQYIEMDLGLGVFDLKRDATEEDDIIINPNTAKEKTSKKAPTIVMMDTDKDEDKDEDMTPVGKSKNISKGDDVKQDGDVVMG
ncbi:hypothetical protein BG004_001881 [Podila humilis]|nr:hypothetical protein BG004_001881 [Podila humilis]